MRSARLRRQDGFIREIVWLAVGLAILAIVVLDGLAVFTAHQSVKGDADRAAKEAHTELVQTLDLGTAKLAAQQYLIKANKKLIAFSSATGVDGDTVITVKAKAHADTYAFKLLRYVGLKKWVDQMTNPSGTGTAD
jgi:heme exporter protein D